MSKHRWVIEGEVDDDDLKTRVREQPNDYPMVADPMEFTWDDLSAAIDAGIVEGVEVVEGTGGEV